MQRLSIVVVTLWLTVLPPALGAAQEETLRQELEALKAGQQAIQQELQEIKALLRTLSRARAAAVPQHVVLSADGGHVYGDPDAKLTLIEYTDFQCPFCAKYVRETFPQLDAEYLQTGKVKYVRKDFPLESRHPHAFKAAEATRCAQEQGKGWEMHARLFGHQHQLAAAHLPAHAQAVGVDTTAFHHCLDSGKYAPQIRQDLREGQGAGVTGTPSFFLGVSDASGQVQALRTLKGAQAYGAFKAAIDALLAGAD
jgi:protein-disulfide isomerase